MIGIIGGGFGLYGWLPSLCQYYPNETILIEKRHEDKFNKRPELQQYKDRIEWLYYTEIIMQSELLVLAIPPYYVYDYLELILHHNSIKRIIVEKPICETPEKSEEFIKQIEAKGIKICSAYIFIYTEWINLLQNQTNNGSIYIKWEILNKNQESSWKWDDDLGGGTLKFYGIHLLSVMTELGYSFHNINKGNTGYVLSFIKKNSSPITILLKMKTNSSGFIISFPFMTSHKSDSPFPQSSTNEDNRIPYLIQLLYDFENNYEKINTLMKKTNELWKQIEQKLN